MTQNVEQQVAQLQQLQQQLSSIVAQKQQLELQLREIERALKELDEIEEDTKVYKTVGGLLIEADRDEVKVALED